jgi:hypothetical protein
MNQNYYATDDDVRAVGEALRTHDQPLTIEAIEQNPWHAVARDLNPWPSAELSAAVVKATDDLAERATKWGDRTDNPEERKGWHELAELAQVQGEAAGLAHDKTMARAAWREPEFSRATIEADPWTAVHLPIPENAEPQLLAHARNWAGDLLRYAEHSGALAEPLVNTLNADNFTRAENIAAAAERVAALDERIERARAEMPALRAVAFDEEVERERAARPEPVLDDRGRVEVLEKTIEKILDLPANDHGERTIPPGFLNEAREVMLEQEQSRSHGEFLSPEFMAKSFTASLVRTTEMLLNAVIGYFVPEPELTPEQVRLTRLANAERGEAREFASARRESAAALDAVNAEIDRHRSHVQPDEPARPDSIYERYPGLTRDVDAPAPTRDYSRAR